MDSRVGPERHSLRYKESAEHPMGQTDLYLPSHEYLLIPKDSLCLGSSILAGPDGLEEQRFCPAVSWHSQCKSGEYKLQQLVPGVSVEGKRLLSAMDTSMLLLAGAGSVTVTQHCSTCLSFHVGLYPQ